jgi:hypothetical protein
MYTLAKLTSIFIFCSLLTSAANATCNDTLADKLRTFEYGKVPLRTLYVRDNNNTTADGSLAHPFKNLYRAGLAGIHPGDELVIQGNVYTTWEGNTESLLVGTADHPIVLRGEPGATIHGNVDSWLHALKLSAGSQYVYIHDLNFVEGGGHTLHMNYVHNIVLEKVEVHNAREASFKLSQSDNVFVRDSEFSGGGFYPQGDPNATEVVDFVTVDNFYIVRSKIHDGRHTLLMLKGPATNGFVAWNDIYDQHGTEEPALSLGAYTGFPIIPDNATFEGSNLTAFANNIHDVSTAFTFKGCQNCAALNNNFNGHGPQLIRYLAGNAGAATGLGYSQTRDTVFRGNVVTGGDANTPMMQCQDGYLGNNNVVEKNVFFNPSGHYLWWCSSIAINSNNVFNYNPNITLDGHVTTRRYVNMTTPMPSHGIPYADRLIVDKAGACFDAPNEYKVGPYKMGGVRS